MPSFVINNTIFTGKILFHEPEMLSTNLFAKNLIAKTTPIDGSVIITDEQIQGKGQGSNQWLSQKKKNLTFSIIYDGSFLLANQQFFLSMAIANGICNALEKFCFGNDLKIKWPNDIILNNKKIGGILIENSIVGSYLKYSVIGVGINVKQKDFKNLPNASSLELEVNKNFNLQEVLNDLCSNIESQFLMLKAGRQQSIHENYNDKLFKSTQDFTFFKAETKLEGKLIGVNELGQLKVSVNGEIHYYNFGEIKWEY